VREFHFESIDRMMYETVPIFDLERFAGGEELYNGPTRMIHLFGSVGPPE